MKNIKCNYFQHVQALVICELRKLYILMLKKFLYIKLTRYLDILQTWWVTQIFCPLRDIGIDISCNFTSLNSTSVGKHN